LCGLGNDSFIANMFKYLNIYNKLEFIELEKSFIFISNIKNKPIFCYSDFSRYKKELTTNFPKEAKKINNLFNQIEIIWKREI